MKKSIKVILFCVFIISMFSHCNNTKQQANDINDNPPSKVIFETDMGNDIDDALALDMLYKYTDANLIDFLGISINKDNEYSAKFIDIMNAWYKYPNIKIATVKDGIEDLAPINFAKVTYESKTNGQSTFSGTNTDLMKLPEAVNFYRQELTKASDNSVVIISVGYFTNISRLLDSPADEISSLTGKELVAKKVKFLSLMGGNFDGTNSQEYNIIKDIPAAQNVFANWPTKVIVSPFEVGNTILFPGATIEHLDTKGISPLIEAYKSYLPMPYDRPTWDLTSVLYAVEGVKDYFSMSPQGKITITDEGQSEFTAVENGLHSYLIVNEEQAEKIKNHFINIISSTNSTEGKDSRK